MGLFRKDNPAEKKLKELTGGLIFNDSFKDRLKRNNLSLTEGAKIQRQLKGEIKEGKLNEGNLEVRLNQLINQYKKESFLNSSKSQKKCPKCGQIQGSDYTFCINCGHEFSNPDKIECPKCHHIQDRSNSYCISCGYDLISRKNDSAKTVCPNCQNIQILESANCSDCGYDFEAKKLPKLLKKCPNCNLRQKSANMYCRSCKTDLRDVDYEDCDELVECANCKRKIPKNKDMCPFCKHDFHAAEMAEIKEKRKQEKLERLHKLDNIRKVTFLHSYDFNLKECPECNTKFLKVDPFCFSCGASVVGKDTIRNDNLEVRDGKLVGKADQKLDDELSSLEALYSQTVQSKYAPTFKVAYVLYLEHFRKNPAKEFSEKVAKKYDTTPNKLKKQAIEDAFIEIGSPLIEARSAKVSDLKEILKEHGLKVSGKKDELIERLGENLSEDELKKHFKSKNYQISSEGEEFLKNNRYILYITSSKDISGVFHPSDVGKIFEERQYSDEEICDKLLAYFKGVLDKKLTDEIWVDFKAYSNAVAQIQEDAAQLEDALNTRFKVFLFDINNFSVYSCRPEPERTRLKKKDMTNLVNLMHRLTLPIDELKELFETVFNEVLFETAITSSDSLVYLLKVFGGEDLDSVSDEINQRYSNPR